MPANRKKTSRGRLLVSVVGARPQFIKLAPMAAAFKQAGLTHLLVHTGQHYDDNMSQQFFRELDLPRPDLNLGVQGGGHSEPTAKMLERLSRVFEELRPDMVVVYGDTTSTLAGALAGAQSNIPVAHVEAGLRSFLKDQPEERNRVVADHLSTWLFAPTPLAVAHLKRERLNEGVHMVGDLMRDTLAHFGPRAKARPLALTDREFVFVTVHRAENTDDPERLRKLTRLLGSIKRPMLLPLHPRTRNALRKARLFGTWQQMKHLVLVAPLGYLDTVKHISAAYAVLTDSGGVQREASWLGTPCLTLRPVTEWPETVASGANHLVDLSLAKTRLALAQAKKRRPSPYREPGAAQRIARILKSA